MSVLIEMVNADIFSAKIADKQVEDSGNVC